MRRRIIGILLSLGLLAGGAASAATETLFSADFQNYSTQGWVMTGDGGTEVTSYQTNQSLHMVGNVEAVATVKIEGISAFTIRASFAAFQLTPHDKCVAEYSLDNGKNWELFLAVRSNQADAINLHGGHADDVKTKGAPVLLVRLRSQLSSREGSCWADGITVVGERTAASLPPETRRAQLLPSELNSGVVAGPVRMAAFAKPAWATAPTQAFAGRLTLEPAIFDGFQVVRNVPYNIPIDGVIKSLPAFDFAFVQDGSTLIPTQRGPIAGTHRDWEIVLEPGQVWNEADDQGFTRAALPFALRERNANCLHNGVLSFLFRADGAISKVYYQISSETCAYFKFNASGAVAAHYVPGAVAGADAIKAAYRAEVAARLPVKPLAELLAAHPNLSASGFALAPPADVDFPTLYGVVVDGTNYVGGCDTRSGPYPFCHVLDLPSYSTAKSVLAAIGLMRLEKLWPGARDALIAEYVPACATPDWAGVTFENALNMTTGVYGGTGFEADENSAGNRPFFLATSHDQKIAFACTHYHRKSAPGTTWVYRTTDSYVLGTAMQEFARRHLSPTADLYRDIHVAQLWRKLNLSPVLDSALRTYDAAEQPLTGYGLTYHHDDIARIAGFLSLSSGAIGGEKMLDDAMLVHALQRDPAHRGMPAGFAHFNYIDGFWARDVAPELGCAKATWVPFMSGFGGISVVMLPNGVIYYYFGDSQLFDWMPAAIEINKLRPICP